MRRVVITGIGPITPVGIGKYLFWEGLCSGKSAVRKVAAFDASQFISQVAAEITNFNPLDFLESEKAGRLDRFSQFSVAAARLALEDSGLNMAVENNERVGVCVGSAFGGIKFAEEQLKGYGAQRPLINPYLALSMLCGAGSCNIAIDIGAEGPTSTNTNGCASGTVAIGEAFEIVRIGQADVMVAGGAEAPVTPLCFSAFEAIQAVSRGNAEPEKACRPFDAKRDGLVIGEGAAVLVLEELEHALQRGAKIYAELAGYSLTNDAYQMNMPRSDGSQAARAMSLALSDSRIPPQEIDYICAHGCSSPVGDKVETTAIKSVFGDLAHRIPISSTKGHHAHTLGAAGAMEAIVCALAIENRHIPPTLNLEYPDPECDLDYTPGKGRDKEIRAVLSNSFGFGGINACLIIKKFELY